MASALSRRGEAGKLRGGGGTKAVAAKAWGAAQSAALKPLKKSTKGKQFSCYWCNSKTHQGKSCPLKKAGKPPVAGARAEKWPKKDIERAMTTAPEPKKVRIVKP